MKLLELFSGTHSIGKVAHELNIDVVSLDKDLDDTCPLGTNYKSKKHFKINIFDWDYKKEYPKGYFDIITASPVCVWWSTLRATNIGKKMKLHNGKKLTREMIEEDIEKYGVPMVDKVFEIIDYFQPKYWWIENPQTGRMKEYINDLIPFYDVDYCKYSDFGYKKRTRFWTNMEGFNPKLCKNDCDSIITIETQKGDIHPSGSIIKSEYRKLHSNVISYKKQKAIKKFHVNTFSKINPIQKTIGGGNSRLDRYRIPKSLIEELFNLCI